jgi:hypothetical protein
MSLQAGGKTLFLYLSPEKSVKFSSNPSETCADCYEFNSGMMSIYFAPQDAIFRARSAGFFLARQHL